MGIDIDPDADFVPPYTPLHVKLKAIEQLMGIDFTDVALATSFVPLAMV